MLYVIENTDMEKALSMLPAWLILLAVTMVTRGMYVVPEVM